METYGKILLFAMPGFLFLVLFEKWYGWRKGFDTVRNLDMISSLSSGITNVTKDVLKISIGLISYEWMLSHLSVFTIKNTWLTYIIAFIVMDFQGYWAHRWSHHINFFWNRHIIHHSSEEFNLACALRQSISSITEFFTFLLLPAALLGVPLQVIAVVSPLHLFAQFWYHTRHINKMGFLEKIIVTPSHHRVHHAMNPEYLDKNLGQIFIIWDKLFGSFQEELSDKPPVYGITRPAATWNPIKINYQHMWLLIKDAWRTKNVWDKLRIWFMPTGWRPTDVIEKFPVNKVEDVYHFYKYETKASAQLHIWSWAQVIITLLFISYFFANIATINNLHFSYIYLYGLFVFLSVYAYTELMDRNPYAIIWEIGKSLFGLAIIFYMGDWFGSKHFHPIISYCVIAYFLLSTLTTAYFVYYHRKEDKIDFLPSIK
jgi:alkylglycerol monooxygenase